MTNTGYARLSSGIARLLVGGEGGATTVAADCAVPTRVVIASHAKRKYIVVRLVVVIVGLDQASWLGSVAASEASVFSRELVGTGRIALTTAVPLLHGLLPRIWLATRYTLIGRGAKDFRAPNLLQGVVILSAAKVLTTSPDESTHPAGIEPSSLRLMPGPAVLTGFEAARLLATLQAIDGGVTGVEASFVYLLQLRSAYYFYCYRVLVLLVND